jgi:hypothetical protein
MSFFISLSSSLNNTYNNHYILYYNKTTLKECNMEDNREGAEAVTTPYSKDWQNKYSYINSNIIIIYMSIIV